MQHSYVRLCVGCLWFGCILCCKTVHNILFKKHTLIAREQSEARWTFRRRRGGEMGEWTWITSFSKNHLEKKHLLSPSEQKNVKVFFQSRFFWIFYFVGWFELTFFHVLPQSCRFMIFSVVQKTEVRLLKRDRDEQNDKQRRLEEMLLQMQKSLDDSKRGQPTFLIPRGSCSVPPLWRANLWHCTHSR